MEDELLRAIVALALGTDIALFPGVAPGHALGACDARQAKAFAALVDAFNASGLQGFVDDDGTFRLQAVTA